MNKNTKEALKWIVKILNGLNISYRIGGGVAVHLYGHTREINDIDISISNDYFDCIIPFVREYIIAGPKHYKNEKWDCMTLSLNYHGQDIDITDASTLLMTNREGTEWIENRKIYQKYPDNIIDFDGINIPLMHPKILIEYKKELSGKHQEDDIRFLESYIKNTFN